MAAPSMIINFSKVFLKQLRKLPPQEKELVNQAIEVFKVNPFEVSLRNHKLQGIQKGIRSISAGYDIRLLYIEKNGHTLILFMRVGTHEDVYE